MLQDYLPQAWWAGVFKVSSKNTPSEPAGYWEDRRHEWCTPPAKRTRDEAWAQVAWDWHERGKGGIGLTVPPGCIVVDADNATTVEWMDKHAGDCPKVSRGPSSAHYYFRCDHHETGPHISVPKSDPDPMGNGLNFDTRIHNGTGYLAIPPSRHKDPAYRWERPLPPTPEDLPEIPDAIAEAIAAYHELKKRTKRVDAKVSRHQQVLDYTFARAHEVGSEDELETLARAFAEKTFGDDEVRLAVYLEKDHQRQVEGAWERKQASVPSDEEGILQLMRDCGYLDGWRRSGDKSFYVCEDGIWRRTDRHVLFEHLCQFHHRARAMGEACETPKQKEAWLELEMKLRKNALPTRLVTRLVGRIPSWAPYQDPWKIPFEDGLYDPRDGSFRPFELEDYITGTVRCRFNETWDDDQEDLVSTFIQDTFKNEDMIEWLQEFAGLSLVGRPLDEHALMFLYGRAGSGKSTFLESLLHSYGHLATRTDFSTFGEKYRTSGSAATPDVVKLEGKRLVILSEVPARARLGATLKDLTGERSVLARGLYEEPREVQLQFTAWCSGNIAPSSDSLDTGVERRLKVVPCLNRVEQRDGTLGARLRACSRLWVEWALRGLSRVIERGGLADAPLVVVAAARDYARENQPAFEWMDECCELAPGEQTPVAEVNEAFDEWGISQCAGNRHEWEAMKRKTDCGPRKMPKLLEQHLGVERRKVKIQGKSVRVYQGLRIRESESEDLGGNVLRFRDR